MTQVCCPSCGLRFARAAAAYLVACPSCGEPPQPVPSAEHVLGFRLVSDDDRSDSLPVAVAVALPLATSSETSTCPTPPCPPLRWCPATTSASSMSTTPPRASTT